MADDYDPYTDPESDLYDPYSDPDSPLYDPDLDPEPYDPYLDPESPLYDDPDSPFYDPYLDPNADISEDCYVEEEEPGVCVKYCPRLILKPNGEIEMDADVEPEPTECPEGSPVA